MRRFSSRVGVYATLLTLLLGVAAPVAALAATTNAPTSNPNGAFDVVVSPASQDLEVKPGGTVKTTIQVRNQGLATEHIKLTVMKFGASGQDGTPQLENVTSRDDFVHWATFSTTHFDAEPNVWTPISVTITPPKTAAFGYYYAIIFSRDNQPTQAKTANLLGAVASLILLDVQAPGAVRKAEISQFSSTRKVYEFLPASFSVRMHNVGNVHVAPRGNIFISKGGKNLAILEVNLAEGNVLPQSYRLFNASWNNGTPAYRTKTSNGKVVLDKAGQAESSLSWSNFNLSKLRFGKYHAKLVMVYDDGKGDVETEAQLNFWVIPWRIIIVTLLVVGVLVAALWVVVLRPVVRRFKSGRGSHRGGPVRLG